MHTVQDAGLLFTMPDIGIPKASFTVSGHSHRSSLKPLQAFSVHAELLGTWL